MSGIGLLDNDEYRNNMIVTGPIGNIDTETAAILLEHEVSNTPFTAQSMKHLPQTEEAFYLISCLEYPNPKPNNLLIFKRIFG